MRIFSHPMLRMDKITRVQILLIKILFKVVRTCNTVVLNQWSTCIKMVKPWCQMWLSQMVCLSLHERCNALWVYFIAFLGSYWECAASVVLQYLLLIVFHCFCYLNNFSGAIYFVCDIFIVYTDLWIYTFTTVGSEVCILFFIFVMNIIF